jgi:undecaprenyl-diphosphatase
MLPLIMDKEKRKFIIILIGILLLTLISFFFDMTITGIVLKSRNFVLDYILISITFLTNTFIILFFLTTLFLYKEHKRRYILPLWLCVFFSFIISFLLKIVINRPRPFLTDPSIQVLNILLMFLINNLYSWDSSFPSFHAVLVFSALPILIKEFKQLKYFWIGFAILVAFSRVYFGVHYLSDVLFGSLLGYIIGLFLLIFEEKYSYGKNFVKKIHLN